MPNFEFEKQAWLNGFVRIAGVDEVGRGPIAGPVTAAAVILRTGHVPAGLADSKALSARDRKLLSDRLYETAAVSVAHATVAEIDAINILHASMLAMKRALNGLAERADFALIDGNRCPEGLGVPSMPVVKGDARSLSIAAASIVAKEARDAIMLDLAIKFPGYGWEKNAGYPTKVHKSALEHLGVTPHHRRSFKPVHKILYQEKFVTP